MTLKRFMCIITIFPILSNAISVEDYNARCNGTLSLQRKLLCQKQKNQITYSKQATQKESARPITSQKVKQTNQKKASKPTFRSDANQSSSQRRDFLAFKPYVPGTYNKSQESHDEK